MAVHDFRSQRLFLDTPLSAGHVYTCTREQANYLCNVLRLGDGDEILVFNGRDGEWRAILRPTGRRACDLVAAEQVRAQQDGPDIDYLFAPLKRARLDYMVQKAVELGVGRLRPVLTRHTIADRVNLARMHANVIEAAEQCGILRLPHVCEPVKLDKLLADWPDDRILLFADEAADQSAPLEMLAKIGRGTPVSVLIGPEGGFSDQERQLIRSLPSCHIVSLGPRIMRADTAAVALLALVNATIGDWTD